MKEKKTTELMKTVLEGVNFDMEELIGFGMSVIATGIGHCKDKDAARFLAKRLSDDVLNIHKFVKITSKICSCGGGPDCRYEREEKQDG